jgi:hypothetical protein
VRQIFETLGATPEGKPELWNEATITLLTISIDGEDFQILRQLTNRALFDSHGSLIASAGRNGEWSAFLGDFLGFNLVLNDKNQKTTQADAACMFLPFYINQDGGWGGSWRTFKGLARFGSPAKSIVEYFTQVVPPQFYVAKAALEVEGSALNAIEADTRVLDRTRARLSKLPTFC